MGSRTRIIRSLFALSALLLLGDLAEAQESDRSIEDEVVADVLKQRSGYGTLADLDYPADYMRRYADRILRASFERRFRAVIRNPEETPEVEGPPAPPGIRASSRPATRPVLPEAVKFIDSAGPDIAQPAGPPEEIPVGFRAWATDQTGSPWLGSPRSFGSLEFPNDDTWRRAAAHVAQNLAREGLLKALVTTLEIIGTDGLPGGASGSPDQTVERLSHIGFPTDLVEFFHSPQTGQTLTVEQVVKRFRSTPRDQLIRELSACRFEYRPTIPSFRSIRDDGGDEIGMLRLQMSRGGDWIGRGDGGAVDIGRQLAAALPSTSMFVSVQQPDVDEFRIMLAEWVKGRVAPIIVVPEPFEISQWAQDNARNGRSTAGPNEGAAATLVPRFASRGEIGALYAPGDTWLLESLAAAGHRCAASPLLFQGGDILFVRDPVKDEFVLVIGEAEVHRNRALGLTREQVLAAYKAEFGAGRCVVLPTISFHVDYEVTFRPVGGRLVALVNDPLAAAKIVARTAVDTLVRLELLDASTAATAREHLDAGRNVDFVNLVGGGLIGQAIGAGVYSESFAGKFTSAASGESGVANFQSILLALDILLNLSLPEDQVPQDRPGGYLRAWRRYAADLSAFRRTLEAEGWKVVAVPSISNGERSLNYLNGIHTPDRYYMPVVGGLLRELDAAAAAVFRAEFGAGVEIVPILTAETQRRHGALRCAVSVLPATNPESSAVAPTSGPAQPSR